MNFSKKIKKYDYSNINIGYYDKIFKKKMEYKVHGIISNLTM